MQKYTHELAFDYLLCFVCVSLYKVPLIPIATERLMTSASSFGRSSSVTISSTGSDASSSSTVIIAETNSTRLVHAPLPSALEQTIKIRKADEPLGVNVELVEDGINGVMVTSVAVGGPFHRDGRIQAGDFLVFVNNESLRNVTNGQARAILRRAQLFAKDLR